MNQCDHGHATTEEIRALPLGGDASLLVCQSHWQRELNHRQNVLKEILPGDLPEWESLKVTSPPSV